MFHTPRGDVAWTDGAPLRVTLPNSALDPTGGLECGAWDAAVPDEGAGDASPAEFELALLLESGAPFVPAHEALHAPEIAGADHLRLGFRGADPLENWSMCEAWITGLERYLRETRARLRVTCELYTALPQLPSGFFDFVGPRLACLAVVVTDDGLDDKAAESLQRRASHLAEWGLRIRPRMCLTRDTQPRWEQRAEAWRALCRSAGVSFIRPGIQADGPRGALARLPRAQEVAELLASIYDAGQHNLTESYPFSHLLQALSAGTATVHRCGSPSYAALDHAGQRFACEHRAEDGVELASARCTCAYGALCDVLAAPCSALRCAVDGEPWGEWERMFCPAVSVLVPKMIDDLVIAARFQTFLMSRPTNERFHAGAREGNLRVWRVKVPSEPSK